MTKAEKRQQELRGILIANGVRNLKEFGYGHVDESNILTDALYKAMFQGNLETWENEQTGEVRKAAIGLLREIGEQI